VSSGGRRIRTTTRIEVSDDRGVFMISVAAELAEMHPQTLRMYEQRGLITPKRSPKGTRLYSHRDVERLRRIQELTADDGMNLAGVERVFELEEQLASASAKVRRLERRARELQEEVERLEELRRSLRAEIVPYVRGGAIVPVRAAPPRHRIPVERPPATSGGDDGDSPLNDD
jgi:MerR family transcriptional regulator, heat shock protein HspR